MLFLLSPISIGDTSLKLFIPVLVPLILSLGYTLHAGCLMLTTPQLFVLCLKPVHFRFQLVELSCGFGHDRRQVNNVVFLREIIECLLAVLILRSEWRVHSF